MIEKTESENVKKKSLQWVGHRTKMPDNKTQNPFYWSACPNPAQDVFQRRDRKM